MKHVKDVLGEVVGDLVKRATEAGYPPPPDLFPSEGNDMKRYRIGIIHEVSADDDEHAIEQFIDIVGEHVDRDGLSGAITLIEEVDRTWAILAKDGPMRWWSTDHGWTDFDLADRFSEHEHLILNLPLGGKWAQVPGDRS